MKGFKALTQANFGSSVFVLGMINIEQSSICCHTPSLVLSDAIFTFLLTTIYNIHFIGAVICSLFYEELLHKFGSCGVSLVYGDVNRGKSKSVELALSVLGLRQARYPMPFSKSYFWVPCHGVLMTQMMLTSCRGFYCLFMEEIPWAIFKHMGVQGLFQSQLQIVI